MRPYIGITDFMNFHQVRRMLRLFESLPSTPSQHCLHVGVMTSYKVLNNLPSKWYAAFPNTENIIDIFNSYRTYNCLHYADHAEQPRTVETITKAIIYGGPKLHALQLDMTWPNPDNLREVRLRAPIFSLADQPTEIILQVGKMALEQVQNDPRLMVERLRSYEGLIHRVLIDQSMGRGVPLEADKLLPFVMAVRENFPAWGITVAGGLGPTTVELARPLIEAIPDLSLDAQARLRPSGSALDSIDWNMASEYLVRALELFY